MSKQHWKAETTAYRASLLPERGEPVYAIYYDPTPEPKKNADGTTSMGLVFPALILADYVQDRERVAKDIARELNVYPKLLEALKAVVRVADRKTDEFDLARAAIAEAEAEL